MLIWSMLFPAWAWMLWGWSTGQANLTAVLALLVVTLAHVLSTLHSYRLKKKGPEPTAPEAQLEEIVANLKKSADASKTPIAVPAVPPPPSQPKRENPLARDQRKSTGAYKIIRDPTGSQKPEREPTNPSLKKG